MRCIIGTSLCLAPWRSSYKFLKVFRLPTGGRARRESYLCSADLLSQDDPVAALPFGLIESIVAGHDPVFDPDHGCATLRNPDTQGHGWQILSGFEGSEHMVLEPGQNSLCLLAIGISQYQAELIATYPTGHVSRAAPLAKGNGQQPNDIIAHEVPVYVIDSLEMVDVDQCQGSG